MARFVYRMQSIFNIKAKMEDQAKMEFGTARAHLNEEEAKLEFLFNRKALYEEQGRELQKDCLKVREIIENRDSIARIKEFIQTQQECVALATKKLEEARVKLQNARLESRTQERLREKAFEDFVHDENVREGKEVDELTSYTHSRKES